MTTSNRKKKAADRAPIQPQATPGENPVGALREEVHGLFEKARELVKDAVKGIEAKLEAK